MMWFDKRNPQAVFMYIRDEEHILCDGRSLEVHPDVIGDFRSIPFEDATFRLVVFDPPHLVRLGDNSYMAHKYGKLLSTWEQNDCRSEDIREITIQFDFSMSTETLFGRNPYSSITRMMQQAKKGLVFPMKAIMKVYGLLDTLSSVKDGFYAVQQFLTILYELSRCDGAKTLASTSYAKVTVEDDSRRILKVKNYISKNYMDELRLPELANMAGMSPSAFSRFFKLHTGRNISEYIIDLRLGYAARMLVDTAKSISEIGFDCGFNNLSNFNRIFKKKKGCSPSEFRENYHKTRIIV